METLKLFLDFLKGVSWPALVLFFILTFREELKKLFPAIEALIGRISSIKKDGVTFDPTKEQENEKNNANILENIFSKIDYDKNKIVEMERIAIKSEIDSKSISSNTDEKIDYLVTHLAILRVISEFSNIFSVIFSSQISAMREMRVRGFLDKSSVMEFFNAAKAKYPEVYSNYSFDNWASFLINKGLVHSANDIFSITDLGREFLRYVDIARPNEIKAF
ncbi:hypothetical protein UCD39_22915 [Nitrospirillum sp. BR 11752]|uniref:hypothetical protein n=1 Tax=Nitrospirillum sp. BR 11752 TaxID=3104293 RepID=UPI002E99FB6D|nr:hypothetical protein [Nitrospirillum sp. BR 11752]